jgi:regulator of nonsense transcripts 2
LDDAAQAFSEAVKQNYQTTATDKPAEPEDDDVSASDDDMEGPEDDDMVVPEDDDKSSDEDEEVCVVSARSYVMDTNLNVGL